LVRVPNWLGDLVMALDSMNGISKEFDQTAFWARSNVSGLLPVFFPGADVLPADELPDRGYDVLVLLTNSFRTAWMGMRARIPLRVGYAGELRRLLLTKALRKPGSRSDHHSLDYSRLARAVGAAPVRIGPPDLQTLVPPHVALFPGANYGPTKIWPHYAELVDLLEKRIGTGVTLYGTAGERGLLEGLAGDAPKREVVAGVDPSELCRRLSSALLAVGNDAGGVHLAARLEVPTVAIFGSTSPSWTAPQGPSVETVSSDLDCSPCFKRNCPLGYPPPCLNTIEPAAVMGSVERLYEDVRRRKETDR
jgi:heptosyltransferase-2